MMRWLVERSLRLRFVVVALALVLIVAGSRAAQNTPLDVFPEFAPPLVEIQTEAPGLSTGEVESLVTVPLENAMNGVPGLRTLRSKSVLGLSSVVMIFEEGTELMGARQLVQERLLRIATSLPTAAHPPVILSPLSSLSRVHEDRPDVRAAVAGGDLHARALDDPAAPDGDPRRRQRRDLGPARSATPGARRSRPAAQQQPHARRRRHGGARRDRRGGGRLSRDAAAAARHRALPRGLDARRPPADHRASGHGRRRRTRDSRECAPHRRRRRSRRRLPATDRRCGDQPWRRLDADRREAAGRQHAAGHPRRRSGDGRAEARTARRRHRHDHLPPGDVHRDVAARTSTARC